MKKLMVLIAALALVATSAMTAAAAEWNFYGNARMGTFIEDKSSITDASNPTTVDSNSLKHSRFTTGRIGARVQVSDELTGGFEYGSGASVNLRGLWGEWNFGAGSVLIGHTNVPFNMFYSNQAYDDNGLVGWGLVYGGRKDMIRLKFGGLEIAAVQPAGNALGLSTTHTIENDIPMLQAKYNMVMDNFSFNLAGAYNISDLEANPGTGLPSYDADSYLIAAGAQVRFGGAYLAGNIFTGENGSLINGTFGGTPVFNTTTAAVVDVDNFGWVLVAGYKLNDMFAFEAGYGYQENDTFAIADQTSSTDEVSSWYLQSTITLTPGFFIVPEFGQVDNVEAGQTEITYYGLKWQINF